MQNPARIVKLLSYCLRCINAQRSQKTAPRRKQARSRIANHQEKRYETNAGLSLSLAYLFTFKDYKDFALAPTLSVGNSFKEFTSFKNTDVDLGVRSYLFKSMYLGTGVRYAQWKNSDIVNDHNCFSWYWEIGFDLFFKR